MKKIKVAYIYEGKGALGGAAHSLRDMIAATSDYVDATVVVNDGERALAFFEGSSARCVVCRMRSSLQQSGSGSRSPLRRFWRAIPLEIGNFREAKRVAEVLRIEGIEIVHSNSSNTIFGAMLAYHLGAKHVWHIREFLNNIDFDVAPALGMVVHRSLIRSADCSIAITRSIFEYWGLERAKRGYKIFNAVGSAKSHLDDPIKQNYILFCASELTPKKGTQAAIRAFAKSGANKRGYKLRIIGYCTDDYRTILNSTIERLGIGEWIEFIGRCDSPKHHFAKAKAFIMSSENEAMGRVTVEAMFSGAVVIARNSGGTPEFIEHAQNGYLFDSEEECAKLIEMVASGRGNIEPIVARAHHTAICEFSKENYAKKIINIYKSII